MLAIEKSTVKPSMPCTKVGFVNFIPSKTFGDGFPSRFRKV